VENPMRRNVDDRGDFGVNELPESRHSTREYGDFEKKPEIGT
jgi:hypothetical protein